MKRALGCTMRRASVACAACLIIASASCTHVLPSHNAQPTVLPAEGASAPLLVGPIRADRTVAAAGDAVAVRRAGTVPAKSDLPGKIGPVLLRGLDPGLLTSAFAESATFDVSTGLNTAVGAAIRDGEVDFRMAGVAVGFANNVGSLEAILATSAFEATEPGGSEVDSGVTGGLRAGTSLYQRDHLAVGVDGTLLVGRGSLSSSVDPDAYAGWFQGDLRIATAYAPSANALLALAPFAGIGFRWVDGVQRLESLEPELDAHLLYGFVGAACSWRPTTGFQGGLEIMGMLGQLQGISVALVVHL